jgi:antirestriction protein ArdC
MSAKTDAFYERITADLIRLIKDAGTNWDKPWQAIFGSLEFPTNAKTKKPYHGGNVLALWFTAMQKEYAVGIWGTYRQFASLGGQVRKGEKGTTLVKWVVTYTCLTCKSRGPKPCDKSGHGDSKRSIFPSVFTVFNVAQQDGYELPTLEELPEVDTDARAEAFVKATGATINFAAQDRAFYSITADRITLPLRKQFKTSDGYYGTLLHELTHWTGHKSRLDRDNANPFGSLKYAAEELVAEFGGVFLAAHLNVRTTGHRDSAKYLANWLEVLEKDTGNLFKAATRAQKSTDWLIAEAEAEAA